MNSKNLGKTPARSGKGKSDLLPRQLAVQSIAAHLKASGKTPPAGLQNSAMPPAPIPRPTNHFALLLSQNVLRHYFPLRAALGTLVAKMPKRPIQQALLLAGLYELVMLKKPDFAVTHSYVELSKRYGAPGFTNAVLRKIIDSRAELECLMAKKSLAPDWLDNRWRQNFAQHYPAIINSLKASPTLSITVKSDVQKWVGIFSQNGYPAEHIWEDSLRIGFHGRIEDMPEFSSGQWWIQDFSSYLVTTLFTAPMARRTVLDIGAAPGGKSANFANQGACLTLLEISKKRGQRLKENLHGWDLKLRL